MGTAVGVPMPIFLPLRETTAMPEAAPTLPGLDTLNGTIATVTFSNTANHYTVFRLALDHDGPLTETVTCVGTMASPECGDLVAVTGEWHNDPRYGRQFRFDSYRPTLPSTTNGMLVYLQSARIKGIGRTLAKRIVDAFGEDTMTVLDNDIDRLAELPKIGPKKVEVIKKAWQESQQQRIVALALADVGAHVSLAVTIYETFGPNAVKLITTQPYELTRAPGVGFGTADAIATSLGIAGDHPERIQAGMNHVLDEATGSGHCYLPVNQLIKNSADLLDLHQDQVFPIVADAHANGQIVIEEGDRAYHPRIHYVEKDLAQHVKRIATAPAKPLSNGDMNVVETVLDERGLTKQQYEAVTHALTRTLSIITGGPGVGKSHTIASIAAVADELGWKVALTAPTGRAAQRMSELADGMPASTIHRLIGITGGSESAHDADDQLDVDLLICDETSMLDIRIARRLFRAISSGTHVVLVGDTDQLPAVGEGNVLSDIIASQICQHTWLTEVFRQAAESGIVQVARSVNSNIVPRLHGWSDLYFWEAHDADDAAAKTLDLAAVRVVAKFGFDPEDIQVLCPSKKGAAGTIALNGQLQNIVNPANPASLEYTTVVNGIEVTYRIGDRIMVVKNNYRKLDGRGIFNGTPGSIIDVNADDSDELITIRTFEGHTIKYSSTELRELAHAWAITIHKSQGSEYPVVILPVTTSNYRMLVRNLLYTGITRARKLVVLVGQTRAIEVCVRTADAATRYTGLDERLTLP
jgi:exodeoxyribonuclease V alpha subunit